MTTHRFWAMVKVAFVMVTVSAGTTFTVTVAAFAELAPALSCTW